MDINKRKSNWRRMQERCHAVEDVEQKKAVLRDALRAIEAEHGASTEQLIYPYERLIELCHEHDERELVESLLPKYYLVLETNSVDEPELLIAAVEKMRDQGYLREAMTAGCSLLYLLYESHGARKHLVEDAWYLVSEMHKVRPDVTAKKLLKFMS